ncbi:hypothetical protein C8Q74DRAFT_1440165 [Fomes fomentarius]|nr:hypothetical protein C8Q74DRAFT_1440165 [Fomes fomentarius]
MFSTVTLTGPQIPHPLTLSREEAFPGRQYDILSDECRNRPDWTPDPLPENGGRLSLVLAERIGAGRSSVVYAVKTEAVVPGSGHDSAPPTVPELCIKISRPKNCRTLACEAWMYERLPEGEVNHSPLLRVLRRTVASQSLPSWGDGGRELSSWVDWRPDIDSPLLAVLVLARGGARYGIEDDENPKTQKDVRQILKDLSRAYILHDDLRPPNLIRGCPYHKRVHKWNILDLGGACIDDPADNDSVERHQVIDELQQDGYQTMHYVIAMLSPDIGIRESAWDYSPPEGTTTSSRFAGFNAFLPQGYSLEVADDGQIVSHLPPAAAYQCESDCAPVVLVLGWPSWKEYEGALVLYSSQ